MNRPLQIVFAGRHCFYFHSIRFEWSKTWNDIEMYGKQKKEWLLIILSLPNGIPTHDTFNRFFAALDPAEFEAGFIK